MRFIIPERAVTHFHLRQGDVVGDFGAGCGYFSRALSEGVGDDGAVYAFEIQKDLVESLTVTARVEHLDNLKVLWCDLETSPSCGLKDKILDAGIMVNAFFQCEDKKSALTEIARMIRPGGKFFVIDWSESFGGLGPRPEDVIDEEDTKAFALEAGFRFERSFPVGEHHYGLGFRRV